MQRIWTPKEGNKTKTHKNTQQRSEWTAEDECEDVMNVKMWWVWRCDECEDVMNVKM